MMLLLSVPLSFVIALACGGRFSNMKYAQIKGLMLPVAAFGLQAFLTLAAAKALFARDPLFPALLTASYLFLCVFMILNIRYKLFAFFAGMGTLCNFAVIALNDFYMPLSAKIVALAGVFEIPQSQSFAYRIADEATRLAFLGDVIYIPYKFIRGFASIGDILLSIGVMFLIIGVMRARPQ